MTTRPVDKVLAAVDAGLDQSLDRLFALLRIPSISTDSAYAKDCAAAADWLVSDLKSLGFEASARATGAALSSMLIYLVMAAVLFVKPEGLLPAKGRS